MDEKQGSLPLNEPLNLPTRRERKRLLIDA
jgi:hypothetical protein